MKRALLTAFVLAAIMTCRAQSFEYLTFEKADGTLVSIPAEASAPAFLRGMCAGRAPRGRTYTLRFERVVPLRRLHSIAMRLTVKPEQDVFH